MRHTTEYMQVITPTGFAAPVRHSVLLSGLMMSQECGSVALGLQT